MENVKIVFEVDSKDIKSTTDELKALNKVTNDEVAAMEKLSASASDAGDGFVSLRTRVKEAKEEAVRAAEKYGEFSTQALAAKKKAGELADQMGDLNRQVNLLNPEAKAKAFSNLAQGVVGAFSIATGALQAFGVKNKEVEALAMKLQAALNITQGIASIGALKEAYQDVKVVLGFTTAAQEALTVATEAEAVASTQAAVATKGFTAALVTNPVFLAVAAIGALAGAMMLMGDDTEEAEVKVKNMTESQKALRQATNDAADAADRLAVAQGKLSDTQSQINKLYRDNATDVEDINEKIRANSVEIEKNNKIIRKGNQDFAEAEAKMRNRRADLREEVSLNQIVGKEYFEAAKKNEELKKTNEELTASIKKKNEAVTKTAEALKEEKKNADNKEAEQKRKQAQQEQKQNAKEQEAAAKERLRLADELRKKLQENVLAEISDTSERIKQAKQFANENYVIDLERLQKAGATQDEIDLLAANHTELIKKLNTEEINSNKTKNDAIKNAEKKLQDSLLALALAQETDPVKRAQIINDAKEKEIDDQLKLVKKGSIEEQTLLADKATAEIEAQKRVAAAQAEVNKKTTEGNKKSAEQQAQDRIAIAQFAFGAVSQLAESYNNLLKAQADAEIADVQNLYDKKLISEKAYNAKIREIKKKQWEADKRAQIVQATMGIAQGIINALSVRPSELVPYAIGLASTVGALQLATIIATKPPQFAKGTLSVPGIDMGKDSVHAILQPGEAVIPTKTNKAYHPTIKAIYEKKISPSEINNFVMSRTKSGGSSAITANVDTYALSRALGKNKTVEVGNANMIGKAMARELLRGQNYRRA